MKVYDKLDDEKYNETFDFLIIATGAYPIIPNIKGLVLENTDFISQPEIKSNRIFTLRDIPDTSKIKHFINKENPKTAVIIGGGSIGVEMAENLTRDGISTTIIEHASHLLRFVDYEMSCDVKNHLKEKKINILLNCKVTEMSES